MSQYISAILKDRLENPKDDLLTVVANAEIDGKEVDWFYGWPGIEKLTKSLGKSWIDVGELI
jgi:hypothetical protein